jgi:sugar/nucleoside kinase (ribokinase family)
MRPTLVRDKSRSAGGRRKRLKQRRVPWVVGAGLITLDIVLGTEHPREALAHMAGGTCGNVLSTLAYLGWQAEPIARFGSDRAGDAILDDLRRSGVAINSVHRQIDAETARIAQEVIRTPARGIRHRFLFSCPACGAKFPRHRPPKWEQYEAVTGRREVPDVFFFDRVSATTLALAEWFREQGTLIYFEPSSIGRVEEFKRAAELSDIVKYSKDRLHSSLASLGGLEKVLSRLPRVEIETRGEQGLRYRINVAPRKSGAWTTQPAFHVAPFRDAAGAGDWCSSGFLYQLKSERGSGSELLTRERIDHALAFGQALAALSCLYLGPRTIAQAAHRRQLLASAQAVQRLTQTSVTPLATPKESRRIKAGSGECSICLRER